MWLCLNSNSDKSAVWQDSAFPIIVYLTVWRSLEEGRQGGRTTTFPATVSAFAIDRSTANIAASIGCIVYVEKAPEFSRMVVDRARRILNQWKDMDVEEGGNGRVAGPAEAVMFVQMVVGFGLKSCFNEDFYRRKSPGNRRRRSG